MRVLGVNAIFHDPSAALVVDGEIVAAAEEERFSRRKHGKRPVPVLRLGASRAGDELVPARGGPAAAGHRLVGYSFDPALCKPAEEMGLSDPWDHLRVTYAQQAPSFLATALPGLDPTAVRFVPHHVAHAASAGLAAPTRDSAVLVLDGRGERASHLAGHYRDGGLKCWRARSSPTRWACSTSH
jgi:carbamoyltransferase